MLLSETLDIALSHRLSQLNEKALYLYFEVKREYSSCDMGILDFEKFKCLEASIFRWQKDNIKSEASLLELSNYMDHHSVMGSFFYYHERGLNHFIDGRIFEAMESFHLALNGASDKEQKLTSLLNICFMQQRLDLNVDESLNMIDSLISDSSKISLGIKDQYLFLKSCEMWKVGNIDDILNIKTSESSQVRYFQEYIKKLSYTKSKAEISNNFSRIYKGSIRTRTLTGNYSEDDRVLMNADDVVERLYLWLWNWLDSPITFSLERVVLCFNLLENFGINSLTTESRERLRNIIHWVEVLAHIDLSKEIRTFYFEGQTKFSIYSEEREFLMSRVDSKNFSLSQLPNLYKVFITNELEGSSKVVVDLANKQVRSGDEVLQSGIITQAMKILYKRDIILCDELMDKVFGISEYDEFIHKSKITSLFFRISGVDGVSLTHKFINNTVEVSLNDNDIEFVGENIYLNQVIDLSLITVLKKLFGTFIEQGKKIPLDTSVVAEKWLKRSQLQDFLGVSKSTMTRILKKAEESKLIKKKGAGKGTLYFISKLEKFIQEFLV